MIENKEKAKFYLLLSIIISALIGITIYVKSNGLLDFMTSAVKFRQYIESFGEKSLLVFFLIQFISVIIAPIPSNVSAVVGGAVFGLWPSFFISILAIISGSSVVFILVRKFGRDFAEKFISPIVLNKYEKYFLSKKGRVIIIMMLFLPFFPDDAISFMAGLSKISLGKYVIIMLLTRPWEIIAASAVGASNISIPLWAWGVLSIFIVYIFNNSERIEKKLVSTIKSI